MVWINIATATAVARLSCRLQARLLGINRLASSASFAWIFGGVFRGFSAGRLPLVGGRWRHRLFRPPQRPRCAYPRKGGYEDAFCSDIKKAQRNFPLLATAIYISMCQRLHGAPRTDGTCWPCAIPWSLMYGFMPWCVGWRDRSALVGFCVHEVRKRPISHVRISLAV